jgi:hypothetical protein
VNAKEYLERVDFALRDLPWRQRRDLAAELQSHLAEIPSDVDLYSRLGSPEQYAAEMREAARLERRRGPVAFIRSFRPRNVVIALVALIAVGLAIGAVAWIDSYQPIVRGNASWDTPGSRPFPGADMQEVQFHAGKPFEVGVSFVNDGRFTVRVESVMPRGGSSDLPLSAHMYLAGPEPNTGGYTDPKRRFHPFDLAPGRRASVILKGVYRAKCLRPGNGQMFWEFPGFDVAYTFLWRRGVAEIDLPQQLQIDGPKGQTCR